MSTDSASEGSENSGKLTSISSGPSPSYWGPEMRSNDSVKFLWVRSQCTQGQGQFCGSSVSELMGACTTLSTRGHSRAHIGAWSAHRASSLGLSVLGPDRQNPDAGKEGACPGHPESQSQSRHLTHASRHQAGRCSPEVAECGFSLVSGSTALSEGPRGLGCAEPHPSPALHLTSPRDTHQCGATLASPCSVQGPPSLLPLSPAQGLCGSGDISVLFADPLCLCGEEGGTGVG